MACCACCCEGKGRVCCGSGSSGVCCATGEYCCGTTCCPDANVCCDDVCCDTDETCCGGECCQDGYYCCDGVCQEDECDCASGEWTAEVSLCGETWTLNEGDTEDTFTYSELNPCTDEQAEYTFYFTDGSPGNFPGLPDFSLTWDGDACSSGLHRILLTFPCSDCGYTTGATYRDFTVVDEEIVWSGDWLTGGGTLECCDCDDCTPTVTITYNPLP